MLCYEKIFYNYFSLYGIRLGLQDLMVTVFENGQLLREYSFDEVRERAELPLVKKRKQEQQQKQQQNVITIFMQSWSQTLLFNFSRVWFRDYFICGEQA